MSLQKLVSEVKHQSTWTRSVAGAFLVGRINTDICLVGKDGVTVKISLPPDKRIVSAEIE